MKANKLFCFGKFFLLAFLLVFSFFISRPSFAQETGSSDLYKVRLYLFHSETCPHCRDEIKFLDGIKNQYPNLEIQKFEVSKDFKNLNLFKKINQMYGLDGSVPLNIIGDKIIVGFKENELLGQFDNCSRAACNNPEADQLLGSGEVEKFQGTVPGIGQSSNSNENKEGDKNQSGLRFDLLGREFCLNSDSSVCFVGVALGLADGINPCMFSVLLFMLGYLLAVGSKKRAIKSGAAFIVATFFVYFLFMYGLIKIVSVLQIASLLRAVVILVAFVVGVVMIKDYFFYGQGISLEIPKKFKPTIEGLIRKGTIPSAILLALFSSLVELPCTSGLPLAYTTIISSKNLFPFWYLLVYNIFFVLPLVVILVLVILAWNKVENFEKWKESSKKYMRLATGILLLLIALALWMNWI
jgi:cytochrome c biogenesis protein CcdA